MVDGSQREHGLGQVNRSRSHLITILRSIGIAACILGILVGSYIVYFGGSIFGAATLLDADFRTPIGLLVGFGGLIVLAIPLLGLISIIGSGLAKSTAARVLFNTLGAVVLLVVLGVSWLVYSSYSHYSELAAGERSGQPAVIHPEGPFIEFYEEGPKSSEGNYNADGQLHGVKTEWHIYGQKKSEGNFVDGQLDGLMTHWYSTRCRREHAREGEINWINGVKEGPEIHWYCDGKKKSEQNNLNGLQDGAYAEWFVTGNRKFESNYKNGKFDGLFAEWYESGQKKVESNWVNGERHGLVTRWNADGLKNQERNYSDGQPNGLDTFWRQDGTKQTEKLHVVGSLQSTTEWNDIGQIIREVDFGDPKKTSDDFATRIEWYENGRKKSAVQTHGATSTGVYTHWYDSGQKQAERIATEPSRGEHRPGAFLTEWYENGQKKSESTFGLLNSSYPKNKIMWDAEGNECAKGDSDCS
jgi:antitoxin component YwqK of YwqJK toxin-antitoxin module